jgi:hypothetical protein
LRAVHVVTVGLEGLMKEVEINSYQTPLMQSVFYHLVVGAYGVVRSFKCSLRSLAEEAVNAHATPAAEGENSDA